MQAQEVLSEHRYRNSNWWPHRLVSSERNTYKHFWGNKMKWQERTHPCCQNWHLVLLWSLIVYSTFILHSSITYYVSRSSLYLSNCCEHRTLDLAASHRRKKCQRCQSWPPHRRCPQCAVLPFGRRPGELDKRSQHFTVVPRCLILLSQGCLVVWKLNTVTVWIIYLNDISDININKKHKIVWKFRESGPWSKIWSECTPTCALCVRLC